MAVAQNVEQGGSIGQFLTRTLHQKENGEKGIVDQPFWDRRGIRNHAVFPRLKKIKIGFAVFHPD